MPRRKPSARGERVRNALAATGAKTAEGGTSEARPVQRSTNAQIYTPPAQSIPFDRLTVYASVPAGSLTGNNFFIAAWDGTLDAVGTSVQLNSPDDGGVYVFTTGLYAITVTIYVSGGASATDPTAIQAEIDSGLNNSPIATWRTGDAVSGFTPRAGGSTTNYLTGNGFSGGIFTTLLYHDLDASITSVSVNLDVVLVRS